jgi:DNA helicase-2/ATP-dependent DNA helicase PcrA
MALDTLLASLNHHQREAATMARQHALVLAGAGSGKTKTIVSRAAYLIAHGTPAHRIQILTFTRRSASEIVERVKLHLGDQAAQLRASTFHTWCISLIRRAPGAFGAKGFSVIDRDDQVQLYRVLRGKNSNKENKLPTAAQLCDIYSFARNTGLSLTETLTRSFPDFLEVKDQLVPILRDYEEKKQERHYLDYDDILALVAQRIRQSPEVCQWVSAQYDYLLVDEMQDTNPLQWSLLNPLKDTCCLFCVGDDAQSIYGFRGADFKNVHSFQDRIPGAVVLKLTDNYRSTQEILDVSNWLLLDSPLVYGKNLVAARGPGQRPQLHNFINEWEESRWVTEDILQRRADGDSWRDHMILARSAFSARAVESSLLAAEIPYKFIGGVKLLESAHVRDALSLLRIIGNPLDEIAIMRYLTLFPGVGDATANRVIERLMNADTLDSAIFALQSEKKIPSAASTALCEVAQHRNNVSEAITVAVRALECILEPKYRNQDWPKRQRDFKLVAKLAEKHTSILEFIEDYLLDPVHVSLVERDEIDDAVTVITIHSAKGTECKTCYVINMSPGSFPSRYALGDPDQVEEERRVLYVALTRAMDNLIVTRQSSATWALPEKDDDEAAETYFFNNLPEGLFEEFIHSRAPKSVTAPNLNSQEFSLLGINLD